MNITLNEAEIRLAKYIGKCRFDNARNNGIANQKMGSQSNQLTDENGMGGEIALCKFLNCYPDMEIVLDLPSYDLVYRGKRIDAKTTTYKDGRLLATLKTSLGDADIYVLVTGQIPDYTLAGWALETELLSDSNIRDLGHGRGYCMSQSQLLPINQLKTLDTNRKTATEFIPPWDELREALK